ncbi:hypothetical protein OI25_7357 [Paraburkholderia fungorum]|uniref:Uncharacterized protein n=2 Tax=Paraburkholderia fungorum TaxID=134537 RepID=A0AAU8SS78_9BURK|nr:hypothetical protein OI25_7357 [Paraburkholderia fungorum]
MLTAKDFSQIVPDSQGRTRYSTHYTNLMTDYERTNPLPPSEQYRICCARVNSIGGRCSQNGSRLGKMIFTTESIYKTCAELNHLLSKEQKLQLVRSIAEVTDQQNNVVGYIRGDQERGFYGEIESWTDSTGRVNRNQSKNVVTDLLEGGNFKRIADAKREMRRRGYLVVG